MVQDMLQLLYLNWIMLDHNNLSFNVFPGSRYENLRTNPSYSSNLPTNSYRYLESDLYEPVCVDRKQLRVPTTKENGKTSQTKKIFKQK